MKLIRELAEAISQGEVDQIKQLVEQGASLKYLDEWRRTPLIWATIRSGLNNKEVVEVLLDLGADINAQNNNGMTALMEAILHDNVEAAKILIERGADIHLTNRHGSTAVTFSRNRKLFRFVEEASQESKKKSIAERIQRNKQNKLSLEKREKRSLKRRTPVI